MIAANSEPKLKLIESLSSGKANLGYRITIHTTVLRYRIPLARCQPTFCHQSAHIVHSAVNSVLDI